MARVPLLKSIEWVTQHREGIGRPCLGLGGWGHLCGVHWGQTLASRNPANQSRMMAGVTAT